MRTSPSPRRFLLATWLLLLLLLLLLLVEVVEVRGGRVKRWDTSYDQPFTYQCPKGQALNYIHSIHHNYYEDRVWSFGCQTVPGTGHCRTSSPANVFDGAMNFQCSTNEVIGGMVSHHHNFYEDRIYSFICCKTKARLSGCTWTPYLNNYDGPVFYRLHQGQVFHGFKSHHHNYFEDRRWRVEICNTTPSG